MATPAPRRRVRETPEAFEKRTSERLWWVCTGLVAGHALLLGSLYRVQVGRHKELQAESRGRWQTDRVLRPTRGLIYDRNGALLVQNEPGFTIVVDPNAWFKGNSPAPEAKDRPEDRRARALAVLKQILPNEDYSDIEALDLSASPRKPLARWEMKAWVSESIVEQLKQATADLSPLIAKTKGPNKGALPQPSTELSGVGFAPSTRRAALNGTLAAHVLGFTDIRGQQAWRGLELSQNKELTGEAGRASYQFDRITMIPGTDVFFNKKVRGGTELARKHDGSDLILTLDAELQHDAEQALNAAVTKHKAEAGVAIILDAHTGDVLAMASAPTYNVNAARQPHATSPQELAARTNWAVELPYEPGSTLKTLTLAAALEENVVTTNSVFHCTGAQQVLNRTIHCAAHGEFQHGHGQQDIFGVLSHSCNIATAECGTRLGAHKLYQYLTAFGLGQRTGIGLPSDNPGKLRDPDQSVWQPIDLANISFGQGVSMTPLQLAAAYTVFVDGKYHTPRLIQAYRQSETGKLTPVRATAPRRVISEKTAQTMREMLAGVVEHGTGQITQMSGYTSGGKTGTAQISEHGHYQGRFVASFVGLAPADKPEFIILTLIRDPKAGDHYGGTVAGPIFKELAEKVLLMRRIQHDRTTKIQVTAQEKQHHKASAVEP